MEELQKMFRTISKDPKVGSSSSSSSSESRYYGGGGGGVSALSSDQSRVLVRDPRRVVSLWTCSKLCAICFAVGIVVGYTLKRRVRRWASKLLRRMKDD